jgi:DNA polymerase-4
MNRLGIETGLDLRAQTLPFLRANFGKSGPYYYWIARGIDDRPVCADRLRKSIGAENTFAQDISDREAAREALNPIIDKVWHHCESSGIRGKTVTLKVKYDDFRHVTRSRTDKAGIVTRQLLEEASYALLDLVFPVQKGVRLLGVSLSSFGDAEGVEKPQLALSF